MGLSNVIIHLRNPSSRLLWKKADELAELRTSRWLLWIVPSVNATMVWKFKGSFVRLRRNILISFWWLILVSPKKACTALGRRSLCRNNLIRLHILQSKSGRSRFWIDQETRRCRCKTSWHNETPAYTPERDSRRPNISQ